MVEREKGHFFSYNISKCSATGYSPFKLNHEHAPVLLLDVKFQDDSVPLRAFYLVHSWGTSEKTGFGIIHGIIFQNNVATFFFLKEKIYSFVKAAFLGFKKKNTDCEKTLYCRA